MKLILHLAVPFTMAMVMYAISLLERKKTGMADRLVTEEDDFLRSLKSTIITPPAFGSADISIETTMLLKPPFVTGPVNYPRIQYKNTTVVFSYNSDDVIKAFVIAGGNPHKPEASKALPL